jgi:hypothetical protein
MAGTRCGGDVLRVIEQGSPGGIRRAIGQWLRVSAALVNAAASCAEQAYPRHALAAAWEGTKVTRVAPVAADAQSVPPGATGQSKAWVWHDRSHDKVFDRTPPPPLERKSKISRVTKRPRRTEWRKVTPHYASLLITALLSRGT